MVFHTLDHRALQRVTGAAACGSYSPENGIVSGGLLGAGVFGDGIGLRPLTRVGLVATGLAIATAPIWRRSPIAKKVLHLGCD